MNPPFAGLVWRKINFKWALTLFSDLIFRAVKQYRPDPIKFRALGCIPNYIFIIRATNCFVTLVVNGFHIKYSPPTWS